MQRKLKPELHSKTHFKAAQSILMEDSKTMSLQDGSANEIIKQVMSVRHEKVQQEKKAREIFSQQSARFKSVHGTDYAARNEPSLDQGLQGKSIPDLGMSSIGQETQA